MVHSVYHQTSLPIHSPNILVFSDQTNIMSMVNGHWDLWPGAFFLKLRHISWLSIMRPWDLDLWPNIFSTSYCGWTQSWNCREGHMSCYVDHCSQSHILSKVHRLEDMPNSIQNSL